MKNHVKILFFSIVILMNCTHYASEEIVEESVLSDTITNIIKGTVNIPFYAIGGTGFLVGTTAMFLAGTAYYDKKALWNMVLKNSNEKVPSFSEEQYNKAPIEFKIIYNICKYKPIVLAGGASLSILGYCLATHPPF